jgi:hypothetical protein
MGRGPYISEYDIELASCTLDRSILKESSEFHKKFCENS